MALFGGPWPPFVGDVYSSSFRLRRNWRFLWCSYHLIGTYSEKDGKTMISYQLAPDSFWFYVIRISGLMPFMVIYAAILTSTSYLGMVLALVVPIGGYFFIGWVDRLLGNRLNRIFIDEVALMPYNHKSRFQR